MAANPIVFAGSVFKMSLDVGNYLIMGRVIMLKEKVRETTVDKVPRIVNRCSMTC